MALMFVDLTGYTKLTEAYTLTGAVGCEALSRTLNEVGGGCTQHVLIHGGDVLQYAGDAFLSSWDARAGGLAASIQSALDCALSMQRSMGEWPTCLGTKLKMKIGLAAGPVEYSILVDERGHCHYTRVAQL
ncbi:hypothetical protein MTO96_004915 [Rhipicephalus appendiculatus]